MRPPAGSPGGPPGAVFSTIYASIYSTCASNPLGTQKKKLERKFACGERHSIFFFRLRRQGTRTFFRRRAANEGAAQEKRGAAMPSVRGEKTGFTPKRCAPAQHFTSCFTPWP